MCDPMTRELFIDDQLDHVVTKVGVIRKDMLALFIKSRDHLDWVRAAKGFDKSSVTYSATLMHEALSCAT